MFRAALARLIALLALASGDARPGDKAKPGVVLRNPAGDMVVLSDREESIPAYFQRQRLVVGGLLPKALESLRTAKAPTPKVFVNYTSHNDDDAKTSLFGDILTIAPVSPAAAALIDERLRAAKGDPSLTLVLRRDAVDAELFHVVGCMGRSSVGFFERKEKGKGDEFAPVDLRFKK